MAGLTKGVEEGRAKGLAEGLAEGRAEGRAEANRETAKKLKSAGTAIEVISQCTGLSIEEVSML